MIQELRTNKTDTSRYDGTHKKKWKQDAIACIHIQDERMPPALAQGLRDFVIKHYGHRSME